MERFARHLANGMAVWRFSWAPAIAQVEEVARIADDDDEFGDKSTDAAVGVGEEAIVVTTNHGLTLLDKSGTILANPKMTDSGFPFLRVGRQKPPPAAPIDPPFSRWFDGRVDYDPVHNRMWISYSEENASTGIDNISPWHLAVSRDMTGSNVLDTFGDLDWWFYTWLDAAVPAPIGNGGPAFNMQDLDMDRYEDGEPHNPIPAGPPPPGGGPIVQFRSAIFDLPVIAVDDEFVYVTCFGQDRDDLAAEPAFQFQSIFILPIEFEEGGVTKSMLDGHKTPDDLITSIRLIDLDPDDDIDDHESDFHLRHYAVQEPFEQEDNAQFFLSVSDEQTGTVFDRIRLCGLWFDDTAPSPTDHRWRLTQHLNTTSLDLEGMELASSFQFFYSRGGYEVQTPDTRTPPASFNPAAVGAFISSAVLVKDANGAPRIFATHHVYTQDAMGDVDGVHVQWYYIDPDLNDFRKVQDPPVWTPQVLETGRISSDGTNAGDCYFPSIGVTKQGVAYIEYTFSNGTTWPELRRVRLNSSYDAVVAGSNVPVVAGPSNLAYSPTNNRWADFSDMQADPFTCDLWSVHTLVHDDGSNPSTITDIDLRDVWLIENDISCNNANLNGDLQVDLYDMSMFADLFATGARRVDMDTDGDTDAADAVLYQAAYDAATGP
ncbi:MAG: hypothetical protein ACFCBV_05045 [Phycisphaerales bacterium]